MKLRMPLNQGPRPWRKSEKKSKSEEFKRTFLEQVDRIRKDFPKLRLERVDLTGLEMKATPTEKSDCSTNFVVKQEQMETGDNFGDAEPETVTPPCFADGDLNDDDHDYTGVDDDHDDIFPDDNHGDNDNSFFGTDSPQNASESGDGLENPESLEHHLAIGDGRRRKNDTSLQCVYCGRQFSKRYSRMLHERLHTGERPYKCSMCDREFSHLSTWRSHNDARHKGQADVIKPPPKIRVQNKNNWQSEIAKQRRLRGEMYQACSRKELDPETGKMVFKSAVLRKERKLGPPCRSKQCRASERRNCNEFSEPQRKEILDHFWKKLGDWNAKRRWIRELVQVVPVLKRKAHSAGTRRNSTLKYHLPLNGEMEQVCGKMFLKTLSISKSMLHTWIKKEDGSDHREGVITNDNDNDNQNAIDMDGVTHAIPDTTYHFVLEGT